MQSVLNFFALETNNPTRRSVLMFIVKLCLFALAVTYAVVVCIEFLLPGGFYKFGMGWYTILVTTVIVLTTAISISLPYIMVNLGLIRQVRQVAAKNEESKIRLEQTLEQRARFVAYVSHELRNPLNGMIGVLDTIDTVDFDKTHKDQITMLGKHSEDLLYIVSDILELSKVDSGNLELNPQSTHLTKLLREQVEFWEHKAKLRNLVIKFKPADDLPDWVVVDPFRLRQIINNLMSNAIKHTHKGYVQVSVTRCDLVKEICVSICDTGSGVPEDLHEAIFDPYKQVLSPDNVPSKVGTGLGLPIARQLAQKMGGDVVLTNSSKAGSNFMLSFKLVESEEPLVDVEKREALLTELQAKKALVVDDVMSNCFVAKALMAKLGIESEVVTSADEALKILAEQQFDIILLDYQLGKFNAEDVYLQTSAGQPHAKYIAYTGNVEDEIEQRLMRIGFHGFLLKPVQFETIRDELLRVFSQAR